MAARFLVSGGTGNWNSTTNWSTTSGGTSGASFPVAGDDAFLGYVQSTVSITVNVVSVCLTFNCAPNYTGTLTMGTTLQTSGNTTLASGMTISGSGALAIQSSAILTSNGKVWPNAFTPAIAGSVYTFADNWQVNGLVTTQSSTYNGSTLFCGDGLTTNSAMLTGTTLFVMNGTGTLNATSVIRNNLTINTTGTTTFGSVVNYGTGTFSYSAGTVITTGSTFSVAYGCNLLTTGITFNNFTNFATTAVTLLSDLTCTGTLTMTTAANIINGSNIYASGNIAAGVGNGGVGGTTNIIANGTGTCGGAGAINNNLTFNTTGTISISSNFTFLYKTLAYSAGTIVTTGSTLVIGAGAIINASAITWNNVDFYQTTTLISDIYCQNIVNTYNLTSTANGNTIYVSGNISNTGTAVVMAGTTNIIMNGTGTLSTSTGCVVRNNLTINTSGTTNISGVVNYNTGTLTYSSGTVVTTGSTLALALATTLNTSGITWNNITCQSNLVLTLLGNLNQTGTYSNTNSTGTMTVNGAYNWYLGSVVNPNGFIAGTSTLVVDKTVAFSNSYAAGAISNNLVINAAGTINITGTLQYKTGTITYTSGNIVATGSTLSVLAAATLNTNGIVWNIIQFGGTSQIYTLSSNLTASGNVNANLSTTMCTLNGSTLYIGGTLSMNRAINGTTNIIMNGSGDIGGIYPLTNNLTINTAGSYTFSSLIYNTGTLTYTAGNITGTPILSIFGPCTLNTNGINWTTMNVSVTATITNNSLLTIGTLNWVGAAVATNAFAGTAGFNTGALTTGNGTQRTYTLKTGLTYNIGTAFISTASTVSIHNIFQSSVAGTKAILILQQGAMQDLTFVDGTDIDSSQGKTIWTYKGILTRTSNWNVLPTQPRTISYNI